MRTTFLTLTFLTCLSTWNLAAEERTIFEGMRHLRIEGPREWSEFPEKPEGAFLEVKFNAASNATAQTLKIRQQDVKQAWTVSLNGRLLGRLVQDENDMVVCFEAPAEAIRAGENTLRIEQDTRSRAVPDDVRVGEIFLDERPLSEALADGAAEIEVVDAETGAPLPARLTILNAAGALQSVGAASSEHLAVRPGTVFTSTGRARFGLPAGDYTIHAGRGFEYSLASSSLTVAAGETVQKRLAIRREVPTEGYVACDTHIHTLTHSGHGDATIQERMVTLAAEGIELPIATDHNVHIDYEAAARQSGVRRYFTPVIGNEVTTRVGHFNTFPIRAGAPLPNHQLTEWSGILDSIHRTPDAKAVILNHARDLHSGVRPFGPKLFNAVAAERLDGWPMRFNAMEVVNSGATQTDPLRLFHDWMALLNAGRAVTPVGSSDSHDVARHFVGQGRTYIRCDDSDPSSINVDQAVSSFLQGQVMVSYGLLAELTVNEKHRSGEFASAPDEEIALRIRVLGPHWIGADHVQLYANGQVIRESHISASDLSDLPRGVKWEGQWKIPKPRHDVHLVAIATGPGVDGLYWRTAKPYQPTSPDWEARVIGCSGAVWIDADGDGRKSAAIDYAERLVGQANSDLAKLVESLAEYDAAVAAQAAHRWQSSGKSLLNEESAQALSGAAPQTAAGFRAYLEAWRESQLAQQTP